ncbi:tripartite tricarboxylate transporter substrate binding protein [Alcaligenaceae bacterium]|nr:tripartite tricarboxylate transporter substrate binding protein [Alcaligenaceae bacterium]
MKAMKILSAAILAGSAFAVPAIQAAESYPSGPITIVVPFPPGGSVDQIGRLLGNKMAERLGQPVVVENRPGAATMIGTNAVVRSKPDGLTLLVAVSSAATNPGLLKDKVPYNLQKDLAPITMLATVPVVAYTNIDFTPKNINEMLELAKTKPVNMASPGYGTMAGLSAEMFRDVTKTEAIHIPYNGGAPATVDTLAGHTQLLWGTAVQAYEQYKGKKLGAIGVTSTERHPLYPDVPTFKEQGIDLVTTEWYGLLAPAGTPESVIAKLNTTVTEIMSEPGINKGYEAFIFGTTTPEEFGSFIAKETEIWTSLIDRLGIKVDNS